jgi:hypothetical protein
MPKQPKWHWTIPSCKWITLRLIPVHKFGQYSVDVDK